MAIYSPRETELLKSFLLAMKEFKKFPKLAYTGVRTKAGKIKVVYKEFALRFIRWRFPFTKQGKFADDKILVGYLAKDDTQTLFLRDTPPENVEPLSESDIDEIEKASEAPAHLQSQQLAHIVGKKHAAVHSLPVTKSGIAVAERESLPETTTTFADQQIDEIASKKWKETEGYTPETLDLGGRQEKEDTIKNYTTTARPQPQPEPAKEKSVATRINTPVTKREPEQIASKKWKEYVPEQPDLGGTREKGESLRNYTVKTQGQPPPVSIPPRINFPKITNFLKTAGTNAGKLFPSTFIQRNAGRFLTVSNIGNLVSGGLGIIAGGALGGPFGALMGGVGGIGLKSWIGAGNAGKTLGNLGKGVDRSLSRFYGGGGNIGKGKNPLGNIGPSKKWLWLLLVLLLFLILVSALGGLGNPTPLPVDNLTSCKFTRSDNPQLIKSTKLQQWIIEAANTEEVSAQVLASIAMHENQGFLVNYGDDTEEIQKENFCGNPGPPICVNMNEGVKVSDEECNDEQLASEDPIYETGRARGLMQIMDVFHPGFPFCDIKANIQLSAQIAKDKMGSGSWGDEDSVKQAVCAYFGKPGETSCLYSEEPPYDYAKEAWEDYQKCRLTNGPLPSTSPQPPAPIGFSLSCPISNPTINCGTAANPAGRPLCGHGKDLTSRGGYRYPEICATPYECVGTRYSEALYHSIDVQSSSSEVRMPYVNGNEAIEWKLKQKVPISTAWGYRLDYTSTTPSGKTLEIRLEHIKDSPGLGKTPIKSGEILGTYVGNPVNHLHLALSVDRRWVEPIQEAGMCGAATAVTPITSITAIDLSPVNDSAGRKIRAFRVGPETNSNKILIIGGMNGSSEQRGIDVVKALFINPGDPPKGTLNTAVKLPASTTLYIIPQLYSGADGFNANNIDINRNFDADSNFSEGSWTPVGCSAGRYQQEIAKGATPFGGPQPVSCQSSQAIRDEFTAYCRTYPTSRSFFCTTGQTGRGGAFSEQETQAIKNLVENQNINAVLSFRSGSTSTYDNVSHVVTNLAADHPTKKLAELLASKIKTDYVNYWELYPVRGDFMGWLYSKNIKHAETEVWYAREHSDAQSYVNAINEVINDPILK